MARAPRLPAPLRRGHTRPRLWCGRHWSLFWSWDGTLTRPVTRGPRSEVFRSRAGGQSLRGRGRGRARVSDAVVGVARGLLLQRRAGRPVVGWPHADVARPALGPQPPAGAGAQPPGRPQGDLAVQWRLGVWGRQGGGEGAGPQAGRTPVLPSGRWGASPRAPPARRPPKSHRVSVLRPSTRAGRRRGGEPPADYHRHAGSPPPALLFGRPPLGKPTRPARAAPRPPLLRGADPSVRRREDQRGPLGSSSVSRDTGRALRHLTTPFWAVEA